MHFLLKLTVTLITINCFPTAESQFDRCRQPRINALSAAPEKGELLVFNDEHFWIFDVKSRTIRERRLIKQYWPDVVTPIDAASTHLENGDYVSLFVKRHVFWMYRNKKLLTQNSTLFREGNISIEEGEQITALQLLTNFNSTFTDLYAILCDAKNQKFTCQIEDRFNIKLRSCEPKAIKYFEDTKCDALALTDQETLAISGDNFLFLMKTMEENVVDKIPFLDVFDCNTNSQFYGILALSLIFFILAILTLLYLRRTLTADRIKKLYLKHFPDD